VTPDVNVLLAASRSDHPHHGPALAWLQDALDRCAAGRAFMVLPMVGVGFLRLATHRRVFVEPTPMPAALDFLNRLLREPGVAMPQLGPEWPEFERLCDTHELAGNDVADAWIAAAVRVHHEHLVTFDQGFRRWLGPRELTILPPAHP
jgi:toxin-antitoxin system PIN domain toxin